MSYLFDASSIFIAIKRDLEDVLVDTYTINLAIYELGNVIWKETHLFRSIPNREALELLEIISEVLSLMRIIDINRPTKEILEIAKNNGINFYDASYAYMALKKKLILVTEDRKLLNKLRNVGIETKNLQEIL